MQGMTQDIVPQNPKESPKRPKPRDPTTIGDVMFAELIRKAHKVPSLLWATADLVDTAGDVIRPLKVERAELNPPRWRVPEMVNMVLDTPRAKSQEDMDNRCEVLVAPPTDFYTAPQGQEGAMIRLRVNVATPDDDVFEDFDPNYEGKTP